MEYFLFTVNNTSWKEHLSTGIAAINNPGHDSSNRQGNAQKQKALSELVGIKKGDLLFFYFQGEKKIMGVYQANSEPFFDEKPLAGTGSFINYKYPIRVEFIRKTNFSISLGMDEIWKLKDKGDFWSLQQQRGDTVGRHSCISLTKHDGDNLLKMFYEKNPIIANISQIVPKKHALTKLNFDLRHYGTELHYEASLHGLLLNDLKKGKHKGILGNYDYFVSFMPTSSQKEMDILLIKHAPSNEIFWYEVIELKQGTFTLEELEKLGEYEEWAINTLAKGNERLIHTIGIAHIIDNQVKDYINEKNKYTSRYTRLLEYRYADGKLAFKEVKL